VCDAAHGPASPQWWGDLPFWLLRVIRTDPYDGQSTFSTRPHTLIRRSGVVTASSGSVSPTAWLVDLGHRGVPDVPICWGMQTRLRALPRGQHMQKPFDDKNQKWVRNGSARDKPRIRKSTSIGSPMTGARVTRDPADYPLGRSRNRQDSRAVQTLRSASSLITISNEDIVRPT